MSGGLPCLAVVHQLQGGFNAQAIDSLQIPTNHIVSPKYLQIQNYKNHSSVYSDRLRKTQVLSRKYTLVDQHVCLQFVLNHKAEQQKLPLLKVSSYSSMLGKKQQHAG